MKRVYNVDIYIYIVFFFFLFLLMYIYKYMYIYIYECIIMSDFICFLQSSGYLDAV